MKQTGYAFFVRTPCTVWDLQRPHLPEKECHFEVIHTVNLAALDYENFAEDLLVDRQWIENFGELCCEENGFQCILAKRRGKNEGILVVTEMGGYVKQAAYLRWED